MLKAVLNNGIMKIALFGELDDGSAPKVRKTLDDILSDEKVRKVVIDMSNLDFMDSTGIGLLIGRYKKLKQFNIPSYITGASVASEKVIELAGLYRIMPKY